jgi:hypothetical protein
MSELISDQLCNENSQFRDDKDAKFATAPTGCVWAADRLATAVAGETRRQIFNSSHSRMRRQDEPIANLLPMTPSPAGLRSPALHLIDSIEKHRR